MELFFEEYDNILSLELLNKFAAAIGQDEIKKHYGNYWPRPLVYQERLWVGMECGIIIGWGSVRPDPVDPVAWLALGVFPEYQKKDYAKKISRFCIKQSFLLWPIKKVYFTLSKAHPFYLEYIKKHHEYIGEMNFPPPGFVILSNRKKDHDHG